MKIFFYIIGLIVLTMISLYFIDESGANIIKQKLKNIEDCTDEDFEFFGIKQSFNDLSYIFGAVGAFWGASFTVEKNIGKWWGGGSKNIIIIKILSIIIVNIVFIFLKYFLPYLFNNYEFNFIIKSLLDFLQYFCLFGVIPLFLEEMELIERKKKFKNEEDINYRNRIKKEGDDEVILFRTSIFKEEKKKGYDEGFVVLDTEVKKKDDIKKKIDEENININNEIQNNNDLERLNRSDDENEENEMIYDKQKENGKEEIYGPSPLVENVQKLEDEEEIFFLEGMEDGKDDNKKGN
jgi:hypothetical protein